MSRTFKILPSLQVQLEFGLEELNHYDGELIDGNPLDFDVYNRTQSKVMSEGKEGNIKFYVFDYTAPEFLNKPFYIRLEELKSRTNVELIEHIELNSYDELIEYETKCLQMGFEGIMLRNPISIYKCGRGTFREGIIYKLKRFKDSEGLILDILPMMSNTNTLETDELGYAKRSYSKAGLVETAFAGRFIVWHEGQEIDVAPGSFSHEEREEILKDKDKYIGKHLKFRYFAHGIKDKPRFPRALGFRTLLDV
jgi:DNA ligase-1